MKKSPASGGCENRSGILSCSNITSGLATELGGYPGGHSNISRRFNLCY